jgi:hypothetical protein
LLFGSSGRRDHLLQHGGVAGVPITLLPERMEACQPTIQHRQGSFLAAQNRYPFGGPMSSLHLPICGQNDRPEASRYSAVRLA